ncbi:MAG TPA: methyltransferase domain-containing protein [Candidatus Saccharimonadales bacterium]|nr:methyltransferase domain-containing protein [Candidatus Saccharimonadales bacterium]
MEHLANYFRTKSIVKALLPGLGKGRRVLDIGAGSCHIAQTLAAKHGLAVTAVDVVDHNITNFPLELYDGKRLPYADGSFDAGLVVFVLHHAADAGALLGEAARVCKRLIIVEDTPGNRFERAAWKRLDYALNHAVHKDVAVAHASHSAGQWQAIFKKGGYKTLEARGFRSLASTGGLYPHTVFVVEAA